VIVWKRENDEWKIHRDISSTRSERTPTVDRVGFPKDYRTSFKMLIPPTLNSNLALVQTSYRNEKAASVTNAAQLPYPYGSVIAMEFANPLKDADGKPLLDSDGKPQRGEVHHVDVMRREPGFGAAYGKNRAGEWEFSGYHVDGSYSTPPARSASCAECHLNKAGAANDFVFQMK
jgi:hypothetical protein